MPLQDLIYMSVLKQAAVGFADDDHFHQNANNANCKANSMASETQENRMADNEYEHSDSKECEHSYISFFRSDRYSYGGIPTSPRVQYNSQTPFLDLSQVYGNSAAKIKFLRSFEVDTECLPLCSSSDFGFHPSGSAFIVCSA